MTKQLDPFFHKVPQCLLLIFKHKLLHCLEGPFYVLSLALAAKLKLSPEIKGDLNRRMGIEKNQTHGPSVGFGSTLPLPSSRRDKIYLLHNTKKKE
jgi:hypothetical protein